MRGVQKVRILIFVFGSWHPDVTQVDVRVRDLNEFVCEISCLLHVLSVITMESKVGAMSKCEQQAVCRRGKGYEIHEYLCCV